MTQSVGLAPLAHSGRLGPLTTVQDAGRPGLAHLGIGTSGAADRGSYRLANRLVGNREDEAALEVTLGGLVVRADHDLLIAVTGAPCPLTVAEIGYGINSPISVMAGQQVGLRSPVSGMRSYLAVRGGIRVPEVLGSRSTDTLSAVGPDPLAGGGRSTDRLAVRRTARAGPGRGRRPS
ncbi:MAG: hypothetical protein WKF47_04425 [Geodermatophilaceae bacterium]